MNELEETLKGALGLLELKRIAGSSGGGCINEGDAFDSDKGRLFIKRNSNKDAKLMFDGELESMKAIRATNTLRMPEPMAVVPDPNGGAVLAMEFLDMKSIKTSASSALLGTHLARLHLQNMETPNKDQALHSDPTSEIIDKFGFHVPTCCGFIPMNNSWNSDWPTFYSRNRLEHQINLIQGKDGDRELMELWSILQLKIPTYFPQEIHIFPSLLHGDLWSGNVAVLDNLPVAYDPAAFYGHHEFDLAIARMFGGFNNSFFEAYHELIPKAKGFQQRHKLYLLFHNLNHWNHFGNGYRKSTLDIMRQLVL